MIYCINFTPCITTKRVTLDLTTKKQPSIPVVRMGTFHGLAYAQQTAQTIFRPDADPTRTQTEQAA